MLDSLTHALLADLVFRGSLSPWIAYPLMVLAVAAVLAVYFRESMKLSPAVRFAMALMRGLALVAIIFLLRKPVIISEDSATKPRPVVILADNTQSMTQRDPRSDNADLLRAGIALNILPPDHGPELSSNEIFEITAKFREMNPPAGADEQAGPPSRAELLEGVFQNPRLNLRDELAKKGPLQEYLFGAQLHSAGSGWEKSLPANEKTTALLYSIQEVLKRDENELPTAIVIATDGIDNDRKHRLPWEDVAREAKRLQVPLHIYGVGSNGTQLLQLRNLESNPRDTLLVDSAVSVTFQWTCRGITTGDVDLNLRLGNRVVATRTVKVKEGENITETLTFVPKKEDVAGGRVDLEGTITLTRNDQKQATDKITLPIRVAESKVRVLYVESSPRWEFKFLMRVLQRDKVVVPSFVLVSGDDKTLKAGPPFLPQFPKTRKELFAYDMLIIGDVDSKFFTNEQLKWISEFVEEGGGLIMIAGRSYNPSSYLGTPLANIMPVEFEAKTFPVDDNKRPVEYQPKLSALGRQETLMSMADLPEENQQVWSKFPGWYWFYPVTKIKPAAQVLLEHPKETFSDPTPDEKDRKRPMPLIARQYYSRGLVMFVGSDETWRWRFNEADKYFGRFWGQAIYQVGLPHVMGNKSQLIAGGEFTRGKPTRVYARLFTQDFKPLEQNRVDGTLERVDGAGNDVPERLSFEPVKGQPGLYVATITKDNPGDYNLKVSASGSSDSALLPVRVTVPNDDEMAPGNLNEKLLRDLTDAVPGSAFYRETELKDLAGAISARTVNLNPPPRKETLLWTRWWVLATIVGLLTVEWLIRKFVNLS